MNNFERIKLFTSILFVIFTWLNSFNYWQNSREQWEKEPKKIDEHSEKEPMQHKEQSWRERRKRNNVDLAFSLFMTVLIGTAYFLIKDC